MLKKYMQHRQAQRGKLCRFERVPFRSNFDLVGLESACAIMPEVMPKQVQLVAVHF